MANISDIGGYLRLEIKDKDVAEVVTKEDKEKISEILGKAMNADHYYGIMSDAIHDDWVEDNWGCNVSVYGNGRWSCYATMCKYFEPSWGALTKDDSKTLAELFKKYDMCLVFKYTDVEQGVDFVDSGTIVISVEDNNTTYYDKVGGDEKLNFNYAEVEQ